jgi:peroxiredoxin
MRKTFISFLVVTLVATLFVSASFAQGGYKISVEIKGEKNKDAILVMHYGTNKYSMDTAAIGKNGKMEFAGKKSLTPGMYLIATDGTQLFDFLIPDTTNQNFSIHTQKDKYLESLSFDGSPENQAFAEYTRFLLRLQKKEKELTEKAKKDKDDEQKLKEIDDEEEVLAKEADAKLSEIGENFPSSLLYSVVKAMKNTPVKRSQLPKDETEKQRYIYEYVRKHYWDNITLSDIRMQYTPILIPAIDNYFSGSFTPQIPDSIIKTFDRLFLKTGSDTAMKRFFTGHVFNKYVNSKIMGMDNVVIHIIDNYYLANKVNVNDPKFIKNITEHADKYRNTRIGKQALNLKMETIGGTPEALYDIDAPYTLVYFYEPSCGHCKQETPKVYKVFQNFKDRGLAGFCVYSQSNKEEWTEYVSKNSMTDWINVWDPTNSNDFRTAYSVYSVPQVYLLDKDKKIIGHRLDSESLSQMLMHLLKDTKQEQQQ